MVEGEEVGEGVRCGCRLFLYGGRSSEYLPLVFAESGQDNPKPADVTPDRLHISAQLGVMRTGKIRKRRDMARTVLR